VVLHELVAEIAYEKRDVRGRARLILRGQRHGIFFLVGEQDLEPSTARSVSNLESAAGGERT
jgi:hypothetical protein